MRKHDRELARLAKAHGFTPLRPTRKSHRRFVKNGRVVVTASTPSDWRGRANFLKELKRQYNERRQT